MASFRITVCFPATGVTVIPTVAVIITIKDRAGKRIFTKQALWSLIKEIKEDVQPTTIIEVFKDPKNLAAQIHKVNAIVIATALRKM